MRADEIMSQPVVKDFEGVSRRVLDDLKAIPSIDRPDVLSAHETKLRNELQALQVAATKLSRAVYMAMSQRRSELQNANMNEALERAKEVLNRGA